VRFTRVGLAETIPDLVRSSQVGEEAERRELRPREHIVEPPAIRQGTHVTPNVEDIEAEKAETQRRRAFELLGQRPLENGENIELRLIGDARAQVFQRPEV
jgi:hypothetical protein